MQGKYKDMLSEKEFVFLQKNLLTKTIPTPIIIIKDHKKANEQGEYPSRLMVPANKFTSGFLILGYLGIIFFWNQTESSTTVTQSFKRRT